MNSAADIRAEIALKAHGANVEVRAMLGDKYAASVAPFRKAIRDTIAQFRCTLLTAAARLIGELQNLSDIEESTTLILFTIAAVDDEITGAKE